MNTLRAFIKHHYKNVNRCAQELGVTSPAVHQWINDKPRNALRYMPEFVTQTRVTPDYFLRVILNTQVELMTEPEVESEQGGH